MSELATSSGRSRRRTHTTRCLPPRAIGIAQPTLLIWGEEDRVIPLANGIKLYDSIVRSRLVVLKNCGHVPPEEKTDAFVRLVADFGHDRKGRVAEPEGGRLHS